MSDVDSMVQAMKLSKKPTTASILITIFGICSIFVAGSYFQNRVHNYFDSKHAELLAENAGLLKAIQDIDKAQTAVVSTVSQQVDKNTGAIDSLRHYYWSHADQVKYMDSFERSNRASLPALIVPEVPDPAQGPH